MFQCKICEGFFRDIYNFKRHQSRNKPCGKENTKDTSTGGILEDPKQSLITEKQSLITENQSLATEKQSLATEKQSLATENNTCKYCLHTFTRIDNKNIHEKNCKYSDDPIRLLEIENDIIPSLPESNTECRFCNKIYHNTSNLNKHITTCKEREVYKQILIKEKSQITINNNTINNNVNCNNTINNNKLILNFGQENLNHLQTENIINLLRDIRKEFGNDQVYLMAGNLITSFDNYIRETPENSNLRIPDSKCLYAEVKIDNGWEKTSVDRSLNKAFKSSASELYNKKEEIDTANERVFQSAANEDIFSEVKQFAKKGFEHKFGNELRKVQTSFKVSKLKNKNVDF